MGVRGLASLLDSHRRIYRKVRFRKSRLLIDGCNLLYKLYLDSGLDEIHGGEYAAFEDLIQKFIRALRDCGITAYVVLDGGTDPSDKKLQTVTQRARERIKKAHKAALGQAGGSIMPALAKLVFIQTLVGLEVQVAQCYGEADLEIAALASEWQCPVLSDDSDFYIFSLGGGVLPISHFRWRAAEAGPQRFIPCLMYKYSSFCIVFDLQPDLLPTFAALAGNDYVNLQQMSSSIHWPDFCPRHSETSTRLERLLCWIKAFKQPQEALEAALEMMGGLSEQRRSEVLQGLWKGIEEYQLPPSSLEKFFIHGAAPTFPETGAAHVPSWMLLPLTRAQLSGDVLDVLQLQRLSLSCVVDNVELPSACVASRPLRQVMYGLLLGDAGVVTERGREGLDLTFTRVPALVTGAVGVQRLHQAAPSERLQLILEALGVTEASLNLLPPELRLPVAATCYWLQNARPTPDEALVKALLLGLSSGEQRAAFQTQRRCCRLDVDVIHAFSQWQICLKDSFCLNQLLGRPLPVPQVARLYEGTVLHHLVGLMRTGQSPRPFLKTDQSRTRRYHTLLSTVHQLRRQHTSSKTSNGDSAPQRRRRQREPLDELSDNLQQLFIQHDDEETTTEVQCAVRAHMDLDQKLSVRTRYRTKERSNRSKNPELARKEECRGWDRF